MNRPAAAQSPADGLDPTAVDGDDKPRAVSDRSINAAEKNAAM
jgi:hypothetical protein